MGKCKLCGNTITGKEFIKHKKFNEILGIKLDAQGSLTKYCGKCVKKLMDFTDAINAPREKYDWRGCKAKFNYDRMISKPPESRPANTKYWEFIEEHKDEEFTLCIRDESGDDNKLDSQLILGMYMFEELPDMVFDFHCTELIITKNGKEYKL